MGKSLVVELRESATDENTSVRSLLLKARVVATKLDLQDALKWINAELDGYNVETVDELPKYRRLKGSFEALNPYNGWRTVHFATPDDAEWLCECPIGQGIGSMSEEKPDKKLMAFDLGPKRKAALLKMVPGADDVRMLLNPAGIEGIYHAVRSLVLNWALELEQRHVRGDGVDFSAREHQQAQVVTNNYFVQNAGVIGNVAASAQVSTHQTASITGNIEGWKTFVSDVRRHIEHLPKETQAAALHAVTEIETKLAADRPSQSALVAAAKSLRNILEQAVGNIIASGLLYRLASLG